MNKIITAILSLIFVLTLTACGKQTTQMDSVQERIVNKTYYYEKDGFGSEFTISIHDDGTFDYYEGFLSSYLGMGSWTLDDDMLILSDDDKMGYPLCNRFLVDGDTLVFVSENSSNFLYVNVADGDRFTAKQDADESFHPT